jgi:predicted O-methyltransferase YrrM
MRLFHPPGHFYSPVSSVADADRARAQRAGLEVSDAYDLRAEQQIEFASQIGPKWGDFSKTWRRYAPDNEYFGLGDGAIYYSILTTFRPKRIVEVGSGFSSAVALDVRDKELPDVELTFIEPYPKRLSRLLGEGDDRTATIHRSAVQDVPLDVFDELGENDILFIDSTHVSKPGSDVNWLFFRVLPRLKPGVLVHIHDIFFPFEYPDAWLAERRSWNEAYLLRAFLSYNDTFEILFFNSWFWLKHRELVRQYFPEGLKVYPGGIWLRRTS